MSVILQIDFPHTGPWKQEMSQKFTELAKSIGEEPRLLWKIWTENESTGDAGGIYYFSDKASAEAYLAMHTARMQAMGFSALNAKILEVNQALSKVTKAPL